MQDKQHPSLRLRLANRILGSHTKDFIQALSPLDGWQLDASGRLHNYTTKPDQLGANVGWCYAANTAIADPTAAVKLTLFKTTKGKREQIEQHEILDLMNRPNLAHTGKQLRQLHFTYMNFVGESYIYMLKGTDSFIPARGRLPDALNIFPSHRVEMHLGETFTKSTVKMGEDTYPLMSFIRDINPDPANPYYGRSVIAAAAAAIDTENQMKEWNRRFFANNARPSLIFKTNEPMEEEAYERWKQQFVDENTGTENAYKPLLIEGGDATTLVNQTDLDFINSRKFSRDELLAMWRLSPGMLGMVENVNRANLQAGFYINAIINVVPRISQFVEQLNASLVQVYDPTYELDFENPVPEDVAAKLKEISAANGGWITIDEAREAYGLDPLPDEMGNHIVFVAGKTPVTLDAIVAGEKAAAEKPQNPEDPADDNGDSETDQDPGDDDPEDQKHFKEMVITCDCCGGMGKHAGRVCTRCDGDGDLFLSMNSQPIPCPARSDHPEYEASKVLEWPQPTPAQVVNVPLQAIVAKANGTVEKSSADKAQAALEERQARGDAKIQLYNDNGDLYVQQMLTTLRAQFEDQRSTILANASTSSIQVAEGSKMTKKEKQAYLAALLAWGDSSDVMKKALAPIIYALEVETAKLATAEINLAPSAFDPTTAPVLDYAQTRAQKIADDTNAESERQLRASLGQGIDNNEDDNQLQARIEEVFGAALTKRAFNTSQYEVTRAQGFADTEAWRQAGTVSGSQWVVQSSNPCVFCLSLDGVIVSLDSNFYSLGDVITADGKTMNISYESIPYPPVHNRCQCARLPVMIS
jgi:HK97 family phage portal protein